jgi:hypothetical protein
MDANQLMSGMIVKDSQGTKVKVTYVPPLDKYGECFFSGIVLESKADYLQEYIGKNIDKNWNSAFYNKV